jgi:uncharacterized protein YgiB involved in biofilm formation
MKPIAALCRFAVLLAAGPALAQTIGGTRTYTSPEECISLGQLNREMCNNAFTNAQAEFRQKTPDFKTREACERAFGHGSCMISICTGNAATPHGHGRGCGVAFTPRFNGVVVSVASLHNATTRPFVSGKGSANYYAARTILKIDIGEHRVFAARGGRGRSGADVPADALPEGAVIDPNSLADPNPNPAGPVATYPVSAKRMKEIQERAKSLGLVPPSAN